jgi:hypothetical protein
MGLSAGVIAELQLPDFSFQGCPRDEPLFLDWFWIDQYVIVLTDILFPASIFTHPAVLIIYHP